MRIRVSIAVAWLTAGILVIPLQAQEPKPDLASITANIHTQPAAEANTSDLKQATYVDLGCGLIPEPGQPLNVSVHFDEFMDEATLVTGVLLRPHHSPESLGRGTWKYGDHVYQFDPWVPASPQGLARIEFRGALNVLGQESKPLSVPICLGKEPLLKRIREIIDWTVANPSGAIFVEGYYQRAQLAFYQIAGEEHYLQHVREGVDKLLARQQPAGYWGTGYGDVYLRIPVALSACS